MMIIRFGVGCTWTPNSKDKHFISIIHRAAPVESGILVNGRFVDNRTYDFTWKSTRNTLSFKHYELWTLYDPLLPDFLIRKLGLMYVVIAKIVMFLVGHSNWPLTGTLWQIPWFGCPPFRLIMWPVFAVDRTHFSRMKSSESKSDIYQKLQDWIIPWPWKI